MIDWSQKGGLEYIVGDRYELLVLTVKSLDLSQDGLVLRLSTDD
jgi:hypothetical protein